MPRDKFSEQSDLYARYRPGYPRELYEFIFQHIYDTQAAWDCGTGSGQVAGELANHFNIVYASDISAAQMDHAPERENIKYFEVPAEDTGFPPEMFDLVTVAQAIHWFDFDRFYEEVTRTTKKNALLAVIGYGIVEISPKLDEKIRSFYDSMFGRYFKENRTYLDDHYDTIPFPFEEIPAPDFENEIVWSRDDLEGFLNSTSPVQQYKREHGSNPVNELMNNIDQLWKAAEKRTVSFPVFLRLGKVR